MNRFRRKSDAAGGAGAALGGTKKRRHDSPSEPLPSQGAPSLELPEASAFRTSLILPHLTRRFSLLRSEDGTLVSLEQMQEHLAAQRKTGRLTAYEVDAVLAQYRLQSMYESPDGMLVPPHSAPPGQQSSRLRNGWSPSLLDEADAQPSSSRGHSFMTESDFEPPSSAVTGYSASLPFPYTFDSPDTTASSSTPSTSTPSSPATYRRQGGNSMFGGRVPFRMPKSTSSTSIHSTKSSRSRKAKAEASDEAVEVRAKEDTAEQADAEGAGANPESDDEEEIRFSGHDHEAGHRSRGEAESEDPDGEVLPYRLPELTPKQVNRISLALGDIAAELKLPAFFGTTVEEDDDGQDQEKEELTGSSSTREVTSPVMSDTEPVDPYFHRLPTMPTISLNAARRGSQRSQPSLSGRSTPSAFPFDGFSQHISDAAASSSGASLTRQHSLAQSVASSKSSSSLSSIARQPSLAQIITETSATSSPTTPLAKAPFHARSASDLRHNPATLPPPSTPLPSPPIASSSRERIPSPSTHPISLSDQFGETRTRPTSDDSCGEGALSPLAFPDVPSPSHDSIASVRRESVDTFNDGPFDLSYTGGESSRGSIRGSMLSRSGSKAGSLYRSTSKAQSAKGGGGKKARRGYASTSGSTDLSSHLFSPAMNGSTSSLESGGSSFHVGEDKDLEAIDGKSAFGDDEVEVLPHEEDADGAEEGLDAGELVGKTPMLEVPMASYMERRPSDELLKEIVAEARREAGGEEGDGGEADLALEDLVMIQERLVRSASRLTAYKLGSSASPSNFSGSEDGGLGRSTGMSSSRSEPLEDLTSVAVEDASMSKDEDGGHALSQRKGSVDSSVSAGAQSFVTSSQMTPNVSQNSSTGTDDHTIISSGVNTPSTVQSDPFEYNNAARDSVHAAWESEKEHLRDPSTFSSLDTPIELEPPALPRLASSRSARDRHVTQSVLIRDVRNQANLATMALKKGTPSPQQPKPLSRFKSVRNASISAPQLVSAPLSMPAFDIPHNNESDAVLSPELVSGETYHSSKKGGKAKNVGARFKMLLKKQSRDHLGLTGDEITPFVDFETSPEQQQHATPPFTPPEQHSSQFCASSSYPYTPEQHETPDALRRSIKHQQSPALLAVDEEPNTFSPALLANSPASQSSSSHGISRLVSRFRRPRNGSDAGQQPVQSTASSPVPPSPEVVPTQSAPQRRPSIQNGSPSQPPQPTFGLGLGVDSGRAPISYDIGARRGPRKMSDAGDHPPATAPLSVVIPPPLDFGTEVDQERRVSSVQSAPLLGQVGKRISVAASIDSRTQLWEAAEELGMPPVEVQEFVDLSYAQSPTSSQGHRPKGSIGSSSTIDGELQRQQRDRSASTSSVQRPILSSSIGHSRNASESSTRSRKNANVDLRRALSNPVGQPRPRSFHDRSPTPPPSSADRRKVSLSDLAEAEPVPDIPRTSPLSSSHGQSHSVAARKHLSVEGDSKRQSRMSIASKGSHLRPPLSPSVSSFRSSGYAGSLFDMYGEEEGQPEDEESQSPMREGAIPEEEATEPADEKTIWQVVNDLKKHRISAASDGGYSFHSRQSSVDSNPPASSALPRFSTASSKDPFPLMVQDHRRATSLAVRPQQQRYPSVFFRDEKRLMELAKEYGGVAKAEAGQFLIRSPKVPEDDEDQRGHRVGNGALRF